MGDVRDGLPITEFEEPAFTIEWLYDRPNSAALPVFAHGNGCIFRITTAERAYLLTVATDVEKLDRVFAWKHRVAFSAPPLSIDVREPEHGQTFGPLDDAAWFLSDVPHLGLILFRNSDTIWAVGSAGVVWTIDNTYLCSSPESRIEGETLVMSCDDCGGEAGPARRRYDLRTGTSLDETPVPAARYDEAPRFRSNAAVLSTFVRVTLFVLALFVALIFIVFVLKLVFLAAVVGVIAAIGVGIYRLIRGPGAFAGRY